MLFKIKCFKAPKQIVIFPLKLYNNLHEKQTTNLNKSRLFVWKIIISRRRISNLYAKAFARCSGASYKTFNHFFNNYSVIK